MLVLNSVLQLPSRIEFIVAPPAAASQGSTTSDPEVWRRISRFGTNLTQNGDSTVHGTKAVEQGKNAHQAI